MLEAALFDGGTQLELCLVARTDHAQHARITTRKVGNRHRGCGRRPDRRQIVSADQRLEPPCIGVEQEDRRLMVRMAQVGVARPVSARLHAKRQAGAIKAGLEAVERVGMTDGFSDDREVARIAARHGPEDRFDGFKGLARTDQALTIGFRDNHHSGCRDCFLVRKVLHVSLPFAGGPVLSWLVSGLDGMSCSGRPRQ